jgi:hypothetical protein
MSARRVLRYAAITFVALIGAAVSIVGLVWLTWNEPWYDRDLIELMQCKTNCIRRDETPRIAHVFPAGMTQNSAVALLKRNGFGCKSNDRDEAGSVICIRAASTVVCSTTYTITLLVSAGSISDRKAESFMACL